MFFNIILSVLCCIILVFSVYYVYILISEYFKDKRNPIKKMTNHDKRFSEIAKKYNHIIFMIKRGI